MLRCDKLHDHRPPTPGRMRQIPRAVHGPSHSRGAGWGWNPPGQTRFPRGVSTTSSPDPIRPDPTCGMTRETPWKASRSTFAYLMSSYRCFFFFCENRPTIICRSCHNEQPKGQPRSSGPTCAARFCFQGRPLVGRNRYERDVRLW